MRKVTFIVLGALIAATISGPLGAEVVMGVKAWSTRWDVGATQAFRDSAARRAPIFPLLQGVNSVEQIKIDEAEMAMLGVSLGYVGDDSKWAAHYSGTQGSAGLRFHNRIFQVSTTDPTFNVFVPIQSTVDVTRKDHEVLGQYNIGETGFFVFGGLKHQGYEYDVSAPSPAGLVRQGSQSAPLFSFLDLSISLTTTGPAAGVGYAWTISDRQSLSMSVGAVHLTGTARSRTTFSDTYSLLSLRQTLSYGFHVNESVRSQGGTADLTYNLVMGSWILRFSGRYQEMAQTSTISSAFAYVIQIRDGSPPATVVVPDVLGLGTTMNGVEDRFYGLAISVLFRL